MAGHACMWLWNQHPVRGGRSATEFLTPFRELVPVFQRRISLSVSVVALHRITARIPIVSRTAPDKNAPPTLTTISEVVTKCYDDDSLDSSHGD